MFKLIKDHHFGEISIFTNSPRMATIYASTDLHLGCLRPKHFLSIFGKTFNDMNFALSILNELLVDTKRSDVVKISYFFNNVYFRIGEIIYK